MWSPGLGRLEHEEDRERGGVSHFCLLYVYFCQATACYPINQILEVISASSELGDFLSFPLSPLTVSKRGNLYFVFSCCLLFFSVLTGGCGIWAFCLLGKCAARLTQDAVLLFPVLVPLLWTVLSELLEFYKEQVLCVLDVFCMSDWPWRVQAEDWQVFGSW